MSIFLAEEPHDIAPPVDYSLIPPWMIFAGVLLALGLVDELLLYFAPCLLGDTARGMFGFPSLANLESRIQLDLGGWTRLGEDWRVLARVVRKS